MHTDLIIRLMDKNVFADGEMNHRPFKKIRSIIKGVFRSKNYFLSTKQEN